MLSCSVDSRRRRLRDRLAQHPRTVTFAEARAVLEAYGFELSRITGSHHVFQRGRATVVLPFKRPSIGPVYVRQILAATEAVDNE